MNKERYPHLHELELLGGLNTDGGQKYIQEHKKEVEDEYNLLMTHIFDRSETFGRTDNIHKLGE